MKSLSKYINESIIIENSAYKKCKTFGDVFVLNTDCESPEDITEDDFESFDLGFVFNRPDMSYKEFVEWVKSVWDNKISDVNVKFIGNTYSVTFKMGDEIFDIDSANAE